MSETKYPNAGPGCDLGRYRTGEVPQVGDRVKRHGDRIGRDSIAAHFNPKAPVEGVVAESEAEKDYTVRIVRPEGVPCWVQDEWCWAARFDLISRAPATAEPVAEEVGAKCKSCDGTGQFISPEPFCKVGLCQECNANGELFAPSPAAVITGPGKYRTKEYDSTGKASWIATIHAPSLNEGHWVGELGFPYLWREDGHVTGTTHPRCTITGIYVEPPPPERFDGEHTLRDFIARLTGDQPLYVWPRTQLSDAIMVAFDKACAPCTPAAG